MSAIPTIAAGTYRLTRDVENPDADRRFKDDWTKRSKFPAGLELIVEEDAVEGLAHKIRVIRAVRYRFGRIEQFGRRAAFAALVPAMEAVSETPAAMFRRLDVDSMQTSRFCLWLVTHGKMDTVTFEALLNEWLNSDEEVV